ncbi:MAG: ABC transporter permease subunit [Myxococcales bacterium]|nr:ABC transporter permease subunit [Myxococcales bacterium]
MKESIRKLSGFSAAFRLDFAEALRSRWALLCALLYAGLGCVFVLVGMRESALLGFTGTSRVLLGTTHLLLLILPLLALSATAQVINRAREEGALELWLSQPIRRTDYILAVALSRYVVLTAPYVIILALLGVVSTLWFASSISWLVLGRAIAVGAALNASFVGLGVALSSFLATPTRSATTAIFAWLIAVVLVDFGLIGAMLQWRLQPQAVFALAVINPVQAARMALLSAQDPELSILGPVGFYLTHKIGPSPLFIIGVAWPIAAGALAWTAGWMRIRRGDVV